MIKMRDCMKAMGYRCYNNSDAYRLALLLQDKGVVNENDMKIDGMPAKNHQKTYYPNVYITEEFADKLEKVGKLNSNMSNEEIVAKFSVPSTPPTTVATPPTTVVTPPTVSYDSDYHKYKAFYNMVQCSEDTINIGIFARLLMQNGVDISEKKLFDYLRNNGYLEEVGDFRNVPTEKAISEGYLEFKEVVIKTNSGKVHISFTPKVTGKGQIYFAKMFGDETWLPY